MLNNNPPPHIVKGRPLSLQHLLSSKHPGFDYDGDCVALDEYGNVIDQTEVIEIKDDTLNSNGLW